MFSPPNLGAWRLLVTPARLVCASEVASFLFQHPAHHARYWKQLVLQNRKGLTCKIYVSFEVATWLPVAGQKSEKRQIYIEAGQGPGTRITVHHDYCKLHTTNLANVYSNIFFSDKCNFDILWEQS